MAGLPTDRGPVFEQSWPVVVEWIESGTPAYWVTTLIVLAFALWAVVVLEREATRLGGSVRRRPLRVLIGAPLLVAVLFDPVARMAAALMDAGSTGVGSQSPDALLSWAIPLVVAILVAFKR